MTVTWTCHTCGEVHEGLPMDFGFDAPTYWDGGRSEQDALTEDLCVWTDDDGRVNYFVRGVLPIPVPELGDTFRYGAWTTLSAESFERYVDDAPPGETYFGWLSNKIHGYPETVSLPCTVEVDEPSARPTIWLNDVEHPLCVEQRDGISVERLHELVELHLHS